MIIYEVNLKITKTIYVEYILWLQKHIKDMLKIKGFKKYFIYQQKSSKNKSNNHLVIHYIVESKELLNDDIDNNSKNMRKTPPQFKDNIIITRRMLVKLDV